MLSGELSCEKLYTVTLGQIFSKSSIESHGVYRWKLIENDLPIAEDAGLGLWRQFFVPMMMYLAWQVGYTCATEVILGDYIRGDKEVMFSRRALAKDKKNPLNIAFYDLGRRCGLLHPDTWLDPDTWLSKTIFTVCQFSYTLFTLLPVGFLYSHYQASLLYIFAISTVGIWGGATYYIKVLGVR